MCHRLYVSDVEGALFVHRMRLLERGNVVGSKALQQFVWNYQAEKEENVNIFSEDLVVRLKQVAEELDRGQWSFLSSCFWCWQRCQCSTPKAGWGCLGFPPPSFLSPLLCFC